MGIFEFNLLRDGDDRGFCDFVYLIKISYNTLKQGGLSNAMNNNHMLAITEQKMGSSDRKVWASICKVKRKRDEVQN